MEGDDRRSRLRSFALGSLVGISAGVAAARRRGRRRPASKQRMQSGLAAFEDAPCFRERVERAREARRRSS